MVLPRNRAVLVDFHLRIATSAGPVAFLFFVEWLMGQSEDDPEELARKIEQASRIAVSVGDRTTYERLTAWIEELKLSLQQRQDARRMKHQIKARARELWEQNGRPPGRDVEFWLQAEAEIGRNK
jgi:hypothetical protein